MLNVRLPAQIEDRLNKAAQQIGKTPDAITEAALEAYLEELEDYFDVMKRKGEKTVTLAQLEEELGLGS